MEEMKTIYQVEGKLCKDFIGQISYTVCLDQTYENESGGSGRDGSAAQKAIEVIGQVSRRRVASLGRLLQTDVDDGL